MNRLLLPLAPLAFLAALLIAGCGTPPNEVVPLGDGVLRAPTNNMASAHCQKSGTSARMLGKAPAESGVRFRCDG